MNEKKLNLPAIIIASVAGVIIAGLCIFGLITINDKNSEIDEKTRQIEAVSSELNEKTKELDEKIKSLESKESELKDSLEQNKLITAERDKLVAEEEARLQAELDTTASDEAEKAAISSMLILLANSEDLLAEMENVNFEGDDFQKFAADLNSLCERHDELKKEFGGIKGLPANFTAAGSEVLELSSSYISEIRDLYDFLVDFQNCIILLGQYGDALGDSFSNENWRTKSVNMIDKVLEAADAARCPAYFESLWGRWKDAIAMIHSFTGRLSEGMYALDYLKMRSAYNLIMRVMASVDSLQNEMAEIIGEGTSMIENQTEKKDLIISEIKEASELEYGERAAYKFKNSYEGVTVFNYKNMTDLYPSLYNTYHHFVCIEAACISGTKDILVECEIPGLTQKFEQKYHITSHITPIYVKPAAAKEIKSLANAWDSSIKITIKDLSGNILDSKSFPIHILGANDFKWYDDEFGVCTKDNILCFIAPESNAITNLKRKAIDVLDEVTEGKMNFFAGYQGPVYSELVDTFLQASSLMIAMSDMGVRYNMDPFSIDGADQHIMFPQQVIDNKSGLCIETSLVIASALQSAGMHTYLVFPPGHAQVAVEIWEGSGQYLLIETTSLPCKWENYKEYLAWLMAGSYNNEISCPIAYLSSEEWKNYIESRDVYLVDCSDGKMLGLTPFAY